jgi:energy-coupling factor transport system permease protein
MAAATPVLGAEEIISRLNQPLTTGNRIRDTHPLLMVLVLASMVTIGVALPPVWGTGAACAAFFLLAWAAGVAREFSRLYLRLFLIVGVLLFVLRAIFATDLRNAFWIWGGFAISAKSIHDAAAFALLIMALCGAISLFFVLVSIRRLTLSLEELGVNHHVSYVVLASFQSIADLSEGSRAVLDAQKSRGIETEGSLLVRAKALVPIVIPVFMSAITQTEERALALDARAFNANRPRTQLAYLPRPGATQWVLVGAVAMTALVLTVGKALQWI